MRICRIIQTCGRLPKNAFFLIDGYRYSKELYAVTKLASFRRSKQNIWIPMISHLFTFGQLNLHQHFQLEWMIVGWTAVL